MSDDDKDGPSGYLQKVYDLDGAEAVTAYYDAWAEGYDAELAANGYATPARCAAALATTGLARTAPILDMGCGTGLSGAALAAEGFTIIDGLDPSEGMLARAAARGVYRDLSSADSADIPRGRYSAIAAAGVIGPGAAEPWLFDRCLSLLAPGGLFCFSFNDHAMTLPVYTGKLAAALSDGRAAERSRVHGPHIPKLGVGAWVIVLEAL